MNLGDQPEGPEQGTIEPLEFRSKISRRNYAGSRGGAGRSDGVPVPALERSLFEEPLPVPELPLSRNPKPYARRRPTQAGKKLLPLDVDFVRKRRAVLNSKGEIEFKFDVFCAMEEVPFPERPVTIEGPTSWCKSVFMKQQLKLLIPKKCNDYDSVPLMPNLSQKYLGDSGFIIRDRDKEWRLTSFRKFFDGRGSIGRSTKEWKMRHSDFYGSNVVKWIDGFPLRQSLIHMETRMISNDYSLVAVHGMGITGRVYNEGEARVPKFLQITVHTPGDCGMYQIRVMVSELPDLFADNLELLLPGRKKKMCEALIKLCYFEYSSSDPVAGEEETPLFGGWGDDKYFPPRLENDQTDEVNENGSNAEDERGGGKDSDVTDTNGNIIIRGKDGKDHLMRPDRMKVLLISRGDKLNRRERRENWLTKRKFLRDEGKLPETPRPPEVPLRMVDRVYACGLRRQGISFYVSVFCFPDRPGNYQFYLLNPESGSKLSLKVGKFEVAKLVDERRPHRFWTKTLEKEILSKVVQMFQIYTWKPPANTGLLPLQMGFRLGHRLSIPGHGYRRTKECRTKSQIRTYNIKSSSRKLNVAPRTLKCKRRFRLKREMIHGSRLYIGVIFWSGMRFIFEVYHQFYFKAEKFTVKMYTPNFLPCYFEIIWADFESFLKETHTLSLLEKAKKKLLKKQWQKLGYGGNEHTVWGDGVRLLFELRLKLLDEGVTPNPLARVVGHKPVRKPKRTKLGLGRESSHSGSDEDIDEDDVDEFGHVVESESFHDQNQLEDVTFCGRKIAFDRRIFSRFLKITDMRVDLEESTDTFSNSTSNKVEESSGLNRAEAVTPTGEEDAASSEEGDDRGEETDDDDDLASATDSIPGSESDSDSEEMDADPKSLYLHVAVHQRGWRLYVVAYDQLSRQHYYPRVPEVLSRSMSSELRRLDKAKRNAVIGVTMGTMTMVDDENDPFGRLTFGDEDDESSSDDSL